MRVEDPDETAFAEEFAEAVAMLIVLGVTMGIGYAVVNSWRGALVALLGVIVGGALEKTYPSRPRR